MNNATFFFDRPKNEPVYGYAPVQKKEKNWEKNLKDNTTLVLKSH